MGMAEVPTIELGTSPHSNVTGKRSNNRSESSHIPVRRRERKLQRFKSPGSAQRFLSRHAATYNVFTVARHLTTARRHRLSRAEAFAAWRRPAFALFPLTKRRQPRSTLCPYTTRFRS